MQKITRATLGLFLAMGLSGVAAAAAPPATGLGQAWPNAVDVSASPHWHVYVFVLNGVEYVQVNDLNGNVIGAVGTAGGQFITLPIGGSSQLVSTPQQSAAQVSSTAATTATTVYRDSSIVVTATPQTSGATRLNAASANVCQDPEQCGAGSP